MHSKTKAMEDKFENLAKEVVSSTNRVLKNWQENGKKSTYEDRISLIRTNIARNVKEVFGWKIYKNFVQHSAIFPRIENNRLIGVEFCVQHSNIYIKDLEKVFSNRQLYQVKIEDTDFKIDYETITNIKFN